MFLDFWNINDAFNLSGDVFFEANGSSILHEYGKCKDQLKWMPRPNVETAFSLYENFETRLWS